MPERRPLMRPPEIYLNGPEDLLRPPEPAPAPVRSFQETPAPPERRPLVRPPDIYVKGREDLLRPHEPAHDTGPPADAAAPTAPTSSSSDQGRCASHSAQQDNGDPADSKPETSRRPSAGD